MREEVKSTMDFVPVETMWGDRDIWLTIERGPEFLTVAKELSDYIAELPLTVEQNDKLVRLAVAQTTKAERNAFFEGARLGLALGRAEQRANAEYQAISDTLKSSAYGEICNALKKDRPRIVSSVTI